MHDSLRSFLVIGVYLERNPRVMSMLCVTCFQSDRSKICSYSLVGSISENRHQAVDKGSSPCFYASDDVLQMSIHPRFSSMRCFLVSVIAPHSDESIMLRLRKEFRCLGLHRHRSRCARECLRTRLFTVAIWALLALALSRELCSFRGVRYSYAWHLSF